MATRDPDDDSSSEPTADTRDGDAADASTVEHDGEEPEVRSGDAFTRKPPWLQKEWSESRGDFEGIRDILRERDLVTVCEEASCPNINECWANEGTATFMVMGEQCTRDCGFCDVETGGGAPLDPQEPAKIADAIDAIGLDYAVITSVDRDDLPDQGAGHFADVIHRVNRETDAHVEVLIPDFRGESELLRTIVEAGPTVVAHNVETVERLQGEVRDPRAGYDQSLSVLENATAMDPDLVTKSSIMLGLGETEDEVLQTLRDLRAVDVDVVTLGQYLRPSRDHLQVEEYVPPERFDEYERQAEAMGFAFAAAGPQVRSSYRAGELFVENLLE
jgi:lipoic acid synthetase